MTFSGFSPELPEFLSQLRANNTREWFQAHRAEYESVLMQPARAFVTAMAEPLKARFGPDVHAEPKVHASILAINRDTRFSPDKTPYKDHLDLWFWQAGGAGRGSPSRERPGYFFRLTPESLILGAGMHAFSTEAALASYRAAVVDEARGSRLEQLAQQLDIKGRTYKRVPTGLPANHPRANWLCHTGLFAEVDQPLPPELYTPRLPEFCLDAFSTMAPLQQWLVEVLPA